jgi:hypothetical protein
LVASRLHSSLVSEAADLEASVAVDLEVSVVVASEEDAHNSKHEKKT